MATPHTVAFHTLGCKLNFAETSTIRRRFEDLGYTAVNWDSPSDIYVLNTCSVTEFADRKCRAEVRKVLRQNEQAKVDLVLGAGEKFNIQQYIDGLSKTGEKGIIKTSEISEVSFFEEAFSFGDRTRTFLKVQDGCDYKCSFCTIPQARGKSRSPGIGSLVDKAKQIAADGVKEIVLTGVNIGDYGLSPDGDRFASFLDLLHGLENVEGVERIRISSIEPNLCSDDVISFVAASAKVVPHFHMPLQSGSDRVLSAMRRRYRSDLYRERVAMIKKLMPHCCIGVDVIVGFPGEGAGEFQETYDFLAGLDISYLHVFTYSERANTKALDIGAVVPMQERRRRNKVLRELSEQKKAAFYAQHVGSIRPVLIEGQNKLGLYQGFTDNYVKVLLPEVEVEPHTIQSVVIGDLVEGVCMSSLAASAPLEV